MNVVNPEPVSCSVVDPKPVSCSVVDRGSGAWTISSDPLKRQKDNETVQKYIVLSSRDANVG